MEYCNICGSTWDTEVFIRCPYCEHEEYLKYLEEEGKIAQEKIKR